MGWKSLIWVLAGLTFGILTSRWITLPAWALCLPFIVTALLFLLSIYATRRNPFYTNTLLHNITASTLFFGIGALNTYVQKPVCNGLEKDDYIISGEILDYTPTSAGDKLLVNITSIKPANTQSKGPNRTPVLRNVKAHITFRDATTLGYGDQLSGKVSLQPSDTPGNYYNQDYTDFLASHGILLTGFTDGSKCRVSSGSFSLKAFMLGNRDRLEAFIENTGLKTETKNFLISVLLGDKSYIGKNERIAFTDAGVSHIFAVSGFHVAMISFFLIALLSLIFRGRLRKWKYVASILLIWLYILMVGAYPSTCRAGIMISIAMAALFLQRKNMPIMALGWAVILILTFAPLSLFDLGFQLSVVCVGALIILVEPLNFIDHRSHPRLFKLVSLTLVSLIASLATLMICAYYFHEFSLMFLPLNLLAVPLLPVFAALSIIYLSFSALGLEILPLGDLIDFLFSCLHDSANLISATGAKLSHLHPNGLTVFLWLLAIVGLGIVLRLNKPLRKLWIPGAAAAFSVALFILLPKVPPTGFIIQKNASSTAVITYRDGREDQTSFPHSATSAANINGREIMAIGTEKLSSEIINQLRKADVVVLHKGIKSLAPELYENLKEGAILVTHPSLHWRYERKILAEAGIQNLTVHSIRYDGPFHLFDP